MCETNKAALILGYNSCGSGCETEMLILIPPNLEESDHRSLQVFLNDHLAPSLDPNLRHLFVTHYAKSNRYVVGCLGSFHSLKSDFPSQADFNEEDRIFIGYILPPGERISKYCFLDDLSQFSIAWEKLTQLKRDGKVMPHTHSQYCVKIQQIKNLFCVTEDSRNRVSGLEESTSTAGEDKLIREQILDETSDQSHQVDPSIETNNIWAPVVYSRNLKADYNFFELPNDLENSENDLILRHVNSTLRSPKSLRTNSRFSYLKIANLVVVGLSCILRDDDNQVMFDRDNREVRAFFGFASRCAKNMPDKEEHIFLSLSPTVRERWESKRIVPAMVTYATSLSTTTSLDKEVDVPRLNLDPYVTRIFNVEELNLDTLWLSFLLENASTSICLNYPSDEIDKLRKDDVLLNVVSDVEFNEISREMDPAKFSESSAESSGHSSPCDSLPNNSDQGVVSKNYYSSDDNASLSGEKKNETMFKTIISTTKNWFGSGGN